MKPKLLLGGLLALLISASVFAEPAEDQKSSALKDTVILVIRHAEKPDSGFDLAPEGEARARAYARYFKHYTVDTADGQPLKLDHLFAAADSKGSHRPRLTLEPTSKALGLKIDLRFANKEFQELADDIKAHPPGKGILIAWHHGEIPGLLRALGADPGQVLPNAKWPEEVYGWVIQLRYDANGRFVDVKRLDEHLMPDDSTKETK